MSHYSDNSRDVRNTIFSSESCTREIIDIIRHFLTPLDAQEKKRILQYNQISICVYLIMVDNDFLDIQSPYYSVLSHVMFLRHSTEDRLMLMEYLIEKGADVNDQDDDGFSPLMKCIRAYITVPRYGPFIRPIIAFLLEHGADPLLCNKYGENAISILDTNLYLSDRREILKMMEEKS